MPSKLKVADAKIIKSSAHPFAVRHRGGCRFSGVLSIVLAWLTFGAAQAQTTNYELGATALLEGPAAGSDSVVLAAIPPTASWAATNNATWLQLSPANQAGSGGTNVIFSYDANPGSTRSGTFTIAGQTLTVTQAGSTYVASGMVTALVSSGLSGPVGVAVDAAGNVYIADYNNNAVKEWAVAKNTVTTLASGLEGPSGVAADGSGNVYISDYNDNTLRKWDLSRQQHDQHTAFRPERT